MTERADACIDPEDLAAFLRGRLDGTASQQLEAHMSRCSGCRELLSALARLQDASADGENTCRGDEGAATMAPTLPFAPGLAGPIPERVGRYRILDKLGIGGMGVVYAAHDPELDRRVAVKVLRQEAADEAEREILRDHLRAEAQAMARLAHPNVVTVHDVGTFGDRIFIAMELVEGQADSPTLSRWLAAEPRRPEDIIAVFAQAGLGLSAAHAAGLVHRDFKPENVLVGRDGRARVTDFGLARAIRMQASAPATAALPSPTSLTVSGTLAGTPLYMAPEQYRGLATDARTDQFSFCVALHIALVGEHPFAAGTIDELPAAVMAGRWRPTPRQDPLPGRVRRALTRGLSVDPDRRFPSMAALLAALVPDSGRRLRGALVATALAALLLAAVLVYRLYESNAQVCQGAERRLAGVWDADRAAAVERAIVATGKPYARAAFVEVARVLDDHARRWALSHTDACEATRVRDEQPEDLLGLRMRCLDAHRLDLRALVERFAVADADLVERAPRVVHLLADPSACDDTEALMAPVPPPSPAEARAEADALRGELAEVSALRQSGRYREGRDRARPLAERARATSYRPLEAEVLLLLGVLEHDCDDAVAAEKALERAVWTAEAGRHDRVAALAWLELMRLHLGAKARFDEALTFTPRITAAIERIGGDDELAARAHLAVGRAHLETSRYAEARSEAEQGLALLERRFGPDDLRVAEALDTLGEIYFRHQGAEARPFFARALAIKQAIYGADHPEVASALARVANVLHVEGRFADARTHSERALAIAERAFGPVHRVIARHLNDIAVASSLLGDHDRALSLFERIRAIDLVVNGPEHTTTATHLMTYGSTLIEVRRSEEALVVLREARAIFERKVGGDHSRVSSITATIGHALHQLGHHREARAELQRAIATTERLHGREYRYLYSPLFHLGSVELALGNVRAATDRFERARALTVGFDPGGLAEIEFALARALVAQGRMQRAKELAWSAHATMATDLRMRLDHAELDRWLERRGWRVH